MAALAAVGVASAQSSVTISGNFGLSVGSTKWGTASSGLQIGRHTGNLAFSGTEDLGGGLRASFRLETSIAMVATTNQTAPAAAANTNATDSGNTTLGDRGAAVTLAGGFGSLMVGRGPTAIRSLFGAMGDVSRMQPLTTISAGSNSNTGTLGLGTTITGDASARIIVGDAYANMVAYTSPSMDGFQVAVGLVPVQHTTTGVGNDATNKDTYSISGMYSKGPLSLGANLTDQKGSATPNKTTTILGSYDLGVAKVGVTYQAVDLATGVDPGKSTVITAAIPYGSGNFGLGYGKRGASASTLGDDAKHMVLGYRYDLSKRTSVNLVWVKLDRAGGSASDVKEQHITLFHSF